MRNDIRAHKDRVDQVQLPNQWRLFQHKHQLYSTNAKTTRLRMKRNSLANISLTLKSSRLNRLVEEISSIFEVKSLLLLSIVTERLVDGDCCCLPLNAGDEGRRLTIVFGMEVRFKRGVFVVE